MRSKSLILFSIFIVLGILIFLAVKITNRNIERIYKNGSQTAFQLLSEIADNYVRRDSELNKIAIDNIREVGEDILRSYLQNDNTLLKEGFEGIWIFGDSILASSTRFQEKEKIILDFYRNELKDKDFGTLINFEGKPFYLINVIESDYNVLILSKSTYGKTAGLTQVLDSLISSSNLVYFAIIDENDSPLVYSSLYEGFLPVKGEEGGYVITTPRGKIFQLETKRNGDIIVAGFSMEPFERIVAVNGLFLVIMITGFAVFLGFLLFNFSKSERYKVDKEREISHLEEIGALSSGFSHEIRNSLNTLSLLTGNIEKEEGDILKEEVKRMNLVMDSIKLLILSEVVKKPVDIHSAIDEAVSLVDNRGNFVEIEFESVEKLKIQANRTLLVTAFSNIIKNAIEASANKIRILERKTGNGIRIRIVDNGKGIDKDKTGRVFEPFYSNKKQSGLGLYLVRKIIDYHGGSIKLESGKETAVDIFLPLKEQS
jgi:signal transduction histidine kinase